MLNQQIEVVCDPLALFRRAAEIFALTARRAVAASGRFSVALSGGSTPRGLFSLLASEDEFRSQISWQSVHCFWGDERHVPPDHPESNYRMAAESLLSKVPIPAANIHRIKSEYPDPKAAAEDYARQLQLFFGFASREPWTGVRETPPHPDPLPPRRAEREERPPVAGPAAHPKAAVQPPAEFPRFDLILLGMGPDGHTASLFPGTDVLRESAQWVVANRVPQLNTWRITLTAPVINHSANVLFLVSGPEKAEALQAVLKGPLEPERYPAQLIKPTNGALVWLVDQPAARLLNK